MRTRFFFIRVVSAVILPITEFHHKFTIAIVTLALPRSASRHYIYKIWTVIIFLLKCHTVGTVLLLYLTLYIIYKIKVMSLQNWYPRETSLLFTCRQMLCIMSVRKCIRFCIPELQSWPEVKNTNMKFMKTQDKNT